MKKLIYTSLILSSISAILCFNQDLVHANEMDNGNSQLIKGPITGPDGEDLDHGGGGGGNIQNPTVIVKDNFNNWESSFFTAQWVPGVESPTMSNGTLTLPTNSVINGEPLLLGGNSFYQIVINNLHGTIGYTLIDQLSGMPLFPDRLVSAQGNPVAIHYYHGNPNDWDKNLIFSLTGITDASMSSFRLERIN